MTAHNVISLQQSPIVRLWWSHVHSHSQHALFSKSTAMVLHPCLLRQLLVWFCSPVKFALCSQHTYYCGYKAVSHSEKITSHCYDKSYFQWTRHYTCYFLLNCQHMIALAFYFQIKGLNSPHCKENFLSAKH